MRASTNLILTNLINLSFKWRWQKKELPFIYNSVIILNKNKILNCLWELWHSVMLITECSNSQKEWKSVTLHVSSCTGSRLNYQWFSQQRIVFFKQSFSEGQCNLCVHLLCFTLSVIYAGYLYQSVDNVNYLC